MDKGKYVILDVEKANHAHSTICQIGVVVYENNAIVSEFETLLNPECEFHPIHTEIHGIKAEDVVNAPTLNDIKPILADYFDQAIICSYGTSDKFALGCYFDVDLMSWIDISKVVRHAIPEFKKGGHKLSKVAAHIGLSVNFDELHNALVDAKVALEIFKYCVEVKKVKPQTFLSGRNMSLL